MARARKVKIQKCPACSSMETEGFGTFRSTVGLKQKHHCRNCGKVWTGDFIEMNKEVKQ